MVSLRKWSRGCPRKGVRTLMHRQPTDFRHRDSLHQNGIKRDAAAEIDVVLRRIRDLINLRRIAYGRPFGCGGRGFPLKRLLSRQPSLQPSTFFVPVRSGRFQAVGFPLQNPSPPGWVMRPRARPRTIPASRPDRWEPTVGPVVRTSSHSSR